MRITSVAALFLCAALPSTELPGGEANIPPPSQGKGDAARSLPVTPRAETLISSGKFAEALALLEIEGAPRDIFTDYYRGVCLEALGRTAEARAVLGSVAGRADAPPEIAAECRARMKALEGKEEAKRFRVWWRGGTSTTRT